MDSRLGDRYGGRGRRISRWWYPWLVGVVALIGIGVAVVGYRNLGDPAIEARQTAFDVRGDDSIEIRFQVVRDHPERPAVCVVRARSEDGDESGRKEVLIQSNESSIELATLLRTSKRAVTGEVFGCSYQVPEYLSRK